MYCEATHTHRPSCCLTQVSVQRSVLIEWLAGVCPVPFVQAGCDGGTAMDIDLDMIGLDLCILARLDVGNGVGLVCSEPSYQVTM